MKKLLFSILLATLFIACDKSSENQPDLTAIRIKERPCETLEYVGKIGNDFDSALDSLRYFNIISEVIKQPLEVLFDYDDRKFYGIVYDDCGNYTDVLDTKGNYYLRTWYCPEENESCIGKIISSGNPCPPSNYPCVPGVVLWLETTSGNYVLTINSYWIWDDKMLVNGILYMEGDEVEITGMVSVYLNQFSEEYFSLEIETIKKLP